MTACLEVHVQSTKGQLLTAHTILWLDKMDQDIQRAHTRYK